MLVPLTIFAVLGTIVITGLVYANKKQTGILDKVAGQCDISLQNVDWAYGNTHGQRTTVYVGSGYLFFRGRIYIGPKPRGPQLICVHGTDGNDSPDLTEQERRWIGFHQAVSFLSGKDGDVSATLNKTRIGSITFYGLANGGDAAQLLHLLKCQQTPEGTT